MIARAESVLLIVRDPAVRHRTREHLRDQGFAVFATGETPVALEWLGRHRPATIISDCLLPGTRTAIPHMLRRRGHGSCPRLVGLVSAPLTPGERLRDLLGFDELVAVGTPVAVLTRRLLARAH